MIPKELLNLLACPSCKSGLKYKGRKALACTKCKSTYAVNDGIPTLLTSKKK